LPHHNQFGKSWAPRLAQALPEAALIGIDEQTGILNDTAGAWKVYGAGQVTLYSTGVSQTYSRGETFRFGP
jgi:cyanophycinase-like exopeptidase